MTSLNGILLVEHCLLSFFYRRADLHSILVIIPRKLLENCLTRLEIDSLQPSFSLPPPLPHQLCCHFQNSAIQIWNRSSSIQSLTRNQINLKTDLRPVSDILVSIMHSFYYLVINRRFQFQSSIIRFYHSSLLITAHQLFIAINSLPTF